jgi:hypothetical protein
MKDENKLDGIDADFIIEDEMKLEDVDVDYIIENQNRWTQFELDAIKIKHQIFPPTLSNLKEYKDLVEQVKKLEGKKDIINCLWSRALKESLITFETTHDEINWETEEQREEREGKLYYKGQRVVMDYGSFKLEEEVEEVN